MMAQDGQAPVSENPLIGPPAFTLVGVIIIDLVSEADYVS
jgi:hypothetical protein